MHGRLRQWPEARGLAARAAELAPTDASPLQASVFDIACVTTVQQQSSGRLPDAGVQQRSDFGLTATPTAASHSGSCSRTDRGLQAYQRDVVLKPVTGRYPIHGTAAELRL